MTAEPTALSPLGLRLVGRRPLGETGSFNDGLVEVQDEGSQLVALLVGARPGMRVVDFCAGAGGEALAIAAGMDNKGHVVACDVSAKRLEASGKRLRRAGVHNVERKLLEDESDKWVKRHKHAYDRVLVDAPCHRHRHLAAQSRRSLEPRSQGPGRAGAEAGPHPGQRRAAGEAGGAPGLCHLFAVPAENEAQIEAFLAANPDFAPVPLDGSGPPSPRGRRPARGPICT